MNGNLSGILAILLVLIVGGGTFAVYNQTNDLRTEIEILKATNKTPIETLAAAGDFEKEVAAEPAPAAPDSETAKIPTSILLPLLSDPILKPTTSLSLTIPEISRNAAGVLALQIKIYTDKAAGYSAFNPKDAFSIVNLTGDDIFAYEVKGQFSSMPAKSSTSGHLLFQTDPGKSSLILKINMGEEMKFYELDFKNKTYKETIIG